MGAKIKMVDFYAWPPFNNFYALYGLGSIAESYTEDGCGGVVFDKGH